MIVCSVSAIFRSTSWSICRTDYVVGLGRCPVFIPSLWIRINRDRLIISGWVAVTQIAVRSRIARWSHSAAYRRPRVIPATSHDLHTRLGLCSSTWERDTHAAWWLTDILEGGETCDTLRIIDRSTGARDARYILQDRRVRDEMRSFRVRPSQIHQLPSQARLLSSRRAFAWTICWLIVSRRTKVRPSREQDDRSIDFLSSLSNAPASSILAQESMRLLENFTAR